MSISNTCGGMLIPFCFSTFSFTDDDEYVAARSGLEMCDMPDLWDVEDMKRRISIARGILVPSEIYNENNWEV